MLPNLPKTNKKKEASFGIKFRAWIKDNPQISGTYELKDSYGKDYLSFSEVKEEQLLYGSLIRSNKGVLMRVEAVVKGMPDYIYCRNMPSFIVIKWKRGFHIISVETFILEKSRTKKKSLTKDRSAAIAILEVG